MLYLLLFTILAIVFIYELAKMPRNWKWLVILGLSAALSLALFSFTRIH